jgi:hypothetical protein
MVETSLNEIKSTSERCFASLSFALIEKQFVGESFFGGGGGGVKNMTRGEAKLFFPLSTECAPHAEMTKNDF